MNITALVIVGDEAVPEPGIVLDPLHSGRLLWRSATDNWQSTVRPADEGVTWIKGHHTSTSPEIAALKTAYALSTAQAPHPLADNIKAVMGF